MIEIMREGNYLKVYEAEYYFTRDDDLEHLRKDYSWVNIKFITRIVCYEQFNKKFSLKLIYPEIDGCAVYLGKDNFLCDVLISDLLNLIS